MLQQESQGDAALTRLTLEAAVDPGKKPQQPVKGNSPLPLHRKICYAIGSAPYQLTNNALGFFFQLFLLDVVQLEPFLASLILFLGRVWDAVSDPVVGFLVGRSPRRRCGKFIPWIVGSTPFGVFFYFLLWLVPTDAPSVSLKLIWYLVMYCCFQTCMSCYHVSYSSLNMFLGGNQRERDSATAYRMSVEVLSTLVGSGIQGEIVGSHHANMRKTCDTENGTLANGTFLLTHMLENTRRSYMVASVVLGSLYCISCLVLFLGVKEQTGPLSPLGKSKIPFFKSLRIILSHRPYIWLLGSFLSASLAFQLAQGIFAFFCTHAAGLPDSFPYLVLILLVVACLSIPFWQWFLVRFGKKTAAFVGMSLFIPPVIVITLVTHNFLVFAFMVALAGCSLSVLYLLPWSMLPDAVDDFKLCNPTCLNLETFFYSFYVFFNKFAGGITLGVSTMGLHFAGYKAEDCAHNPQVILALRILMAPVPIALLLCAMVMFCSYPINEERRKQIQVEMEAACLRGQAESPE
ncbi:sodium-dependent lysophosphatidylcholine symporter 1-like isoform X2 [Eublepharis macularius]|uniref:Sodium-dependent lysophosphatidylcholine symporter 1-like isoform X2 n=1 Tax=Eublepharis macularius TaxID=481883 RepID=A0AA97JG18_EUBMA|nr:sodium-dependent lysophosphatidylcholine symporter 1-like isoform X2 [Eublepharis macularius]